MTCMGFFFKPDFGKTQIHTLNFRKAGSIREASSNIAFRIKYMFQHFSKKGRSSGTLLIFLEVIWMSWERCVLKPTQNSSPLFSFNAVSLC